MNDHRTMIVAMLGREPDAEDRRLLDLMLGHMPVALLTDEGVVAEAVSRVEHVRELRRAVSEATVGARRMAEIDGEQYAIQVANKVWRRIMDHLPADTATTLTRQFRIACMWTLLVLIVGSIGGWSLREWRYDRERRSTQAATDRAFNRCIDAAEGAALSGGQGVAALRSDSGAYRTQARTCAAEYADRRAGG